LNWNPPELIMGLRYDSQFDMWSIGCILVEMVIGRSLFPACDENELIEYFEYRIGRIPTNMINHANPGQRRRLFDRNKKVIHSTHRQRILPKDCAPGQRPIRALLEGTPREGDNDFINFID